MLIDKDRQLIRFDGFGEMNRWLNDPTNVAVARELREGNAGGGASNSRFYGRTTLQDQMRFSLLGDDSQVKPAQDLMDKLDCTIALPSMQDEATVAGCYPVVPEALMGEPECMRLPQAHDSDVAPLAIFVDLTTSAGIEPSIVRKRGAAVLALTMILAAARPVSLQVGCIMGSSDSVKGGDRYVAVSTRVDTAPLDLARAAWALTDVGCPRRLFYAAARTFAFNGGWPEFKGCGYAQVQTDAYRKRAAEVLDLGDETLYIPPISLYDGEVKEMCERPVEWLRATVAKFSTAVIEA